MTYADNRIIRLSNAKRLVSEYPEVREKAGFDWRAEIQSAMERQPNIGLLQPQDRADARYLIKKYGGYYRPNSHGYTGSPIVAGRYTLAEAEDITHPNGPDGPRDGMSYIHENDLLDEDWLAYVALRASRSEVTERQVSAALDALRGYVVESGMEDPGEWRGLDEKNRGHLLAGMRRSIEAAMAVGGA